MDWTGLDWTGLDWTGLDWTGLDWTGLDWTGLDWTGFVKGGFVKHGFVKGGFTKECKIQKICRRTVYNTLSGRLQNKNLLREKNCPNQVRGADGKFRIESNSHTNFRVRFCSITEPNRT